MSQVPWCGSATNWAIEDHEIEKFALVDRRLGEDIDAAMAVFSELTSNRAERLLNLTMEEFPGARHFSRDDTTIEPSAPTEPTTELLKALSERLGLADLWRATATARPSGGESDPLGDWIERAAELEWAFKTATADQHLQGNEKAKKANPTQPHKFAARYGFQYVRWVWTGSPAAGTHVGVGVVADSERASVTPLWVVLDVTTPGYGLGRDLLQRSKLAPLSEDEIGVWVPIPLDPDLQWGELRKQIYDRMQGIRGVLAEKK